MNQLENNYQDNPLIPRATPETATLAPKKFKIPTDPKIRVLLVLALIIIILIPLSLVSIILRKRPTAISNSTPTPITAPSPTPTSEIAIPSDLQYKLDQISKLSQNPKTIDPPQIDENIGVVSN